MNLIRDHKLLFAALLLSALASGCNSTKKQPAPAEVSTKAAEPATPDPTPPLKPEEPTPATAVEVPPPPAPPVAETKAPALKDVFPFIRADIAGKLVEFDGIVPINCHDPATPDVYLELIACAPDTREHESLVMTRAKPSHIHAALLAIGLKPGEPGSWKVENKKLVAIPPRGDPLEIRIAYIGPGGTEIECPVADWVITAQTHAPFIPREAAAPRWLFTGSVFVKRQGKELYDADGSGSIVGLTTFGSEVIGWRDTISPEAAIDAPEWIADAKKVPQAGTPVVVRIRPASPS